MTNDKWRTTQKADGPRAESQTGIGSETLTLSSSALQRGRKLGIDTSGMSEGRLRSFFTILGPALMPG